MGKPMSINIQDKGLFQNNNTRIMSINIDITVDIPVCGHTGWLMLGFKIIFRITRDRQVTGRKTITCGLIHITPLWLYSPYGHGSVSSLGPGTIQSHDPRENTADMRDDTTLAMIIVYVDTYGLLNKSNQIMKFKNIMWIYRYN